MDGFRPALVLPTSSAPTRKTCNALLEVTRLGARVLAFAQGEFQGRAVGSCFAADPRTKPNPAGAECGVHEGKKTKLTGGEANQAIPVGAIS